MNLAEIRQTLIDIYGNTLTSNESYYNRVINLSYRKIAGLADWWWLEGSTVLTCHAPHGDFVCTAVQGSANITAVAGASTAHSFTASYTPPAWFETGERIFEITAANATAKTLTLDSSWVDASSTAQAFTMWKDTYPLPSDCLKVLGVIPRASPNTMPLRQVLPEDIDAHGFLVGQYNYDIADRFSVAHDANNDFYIRLSPPPRQKAEYLVRYFREVTDLALDLDEPLLPTNHHPLLVDQAKVELLKNEGEDADRVQQFDAAVAQGMARLYREQSRRSNALQRFGRRQAVFSAPPMPFSLRNTEAGI